MLITCIWYTLFKSHLVQSQITFNDYYWLSGGRIILPHAEMRFDYFDIRTQAAGRINKTLNSSNFFPFIQIFSFSPCSKQSQAVPEWTSMHNEDGRSPGKSLSYAASHVVWCDLHMNTNTLPGNLTLYAVSCVKALGRGDKKQGEIIRKCLGPWWEKGWRFISADDRL